MAVTSKGKKLQSEMVGSVNGILKAFDLLPFWDKLNTDGEYFLETPLALILQLCQAMGLMDELRDWLAQYIIYAIPALELGIKGSLLANMMASIQCTTKITIPEEARMFYFNRVFRATAPYINEEGLEYYQNKHTTVYTLKDSTLVGYKKTLTPDEYKSLASINKNKYEKKTVAEITPNEGGQKSLYKSGDYVYLTQKIDGPGIPVPIWSVDYSDLLSHCPWSLGYATLPNERAAEYFGVPQDEYEEVDAVDMYGTTITNREGKPVKRMVKSKEADKSPYQLARCIDCNAFLWFVKNKGRFRQPTIVTEDSEFQELMKNGLMSYKSVTSDGSNSKFNSFVNGSCITSYDPTYGSDKTHACRWLSVITNVARDEQDNVTSFKVMPVVSNGSRSTYLSPDINWYVNDKDYFTVNIGIDEITEGKSESKTQARIHDDDYMNEFRPICSFNYNEGSHCFNVKVLPEPFIHYPVIVPRHKENGVSVKPYHEPLTRLRKILFDAEGRPGGVTAAKSKRFTVVPYVNDATNMVYKDVDTTNETCIYRLTDYQGVMSSSIVLTENMKDGTYKLQKIGTSGYEDLNYGATSADKFLIAPILFECYRGLTVYQFNYDMIMGMKMLNGRSLVAALIDTLLGINIHIGLTQEQKQAQKIIISIVEEMINANDEIDDCYFTFSNEEVNRMLQDSESKYRAGYGFRDGYEFSEDDINEIRTMITQMDSFASPEKGKQIFENAFSRVTDVYKEGAEAEVTYGIHAGLIAKLCTEMVLQIVLQTLFTPKVMMVLQVNNYIMRKNNGELDFTIDFISLMRALIGVIYNIVKEIVEKFLQDLLEFMLAKLRSIIAAFATGLIKEQLDYWLKLITQIILACGFRIRNYNDAGIDNVMYADIAETNQQPKTSEC